jgi:hypothetical protein
MILTIANVQYVSAVYVNIRPLHANPAHVGQKVFVTHIAHVLYSSKSTHRCTTQSGGGGIQAMYSHPRQVMSCHVTTHIISHVLYSKKNPAEQSVRTNRPLHVPRRPIGAHVPDPVVGWGVEADSPTNAK